MNLKVRGAMLPLGCVFLSTRAKTVGGCCNPLGRTRVNRLEKAANFHGRYGQIP